MVLLRFTPLWNLLQYVYVWTKRLVCLRFLCRKTTFFIIDPLVWLFLYSVDGSWINLIFCFLIYNPKHRYNNGPRKPCCSVRDCRPQNIISTLSCIKSKSWDPVLQVFLPSKTEFCYEYSLNWARQTEYINKAIEGGNEDVGTSGSDCEVRF